jgi:RNA polymerase sigma-70 factor (ECF subfamily)
LAEPIKVASFEETVLPHLAAAYNLARWLVRNDEDAEDAVQEAYLRAFRSFDGFRGASEGRTWLLTIVRNTCYTRLKQNRITDLTEAFDEEIHGVEAEAANPEAMLVERTMSSGSDRPWRSYHPNFVR